MFAFVKEYENIDFPEAVRRLAERAKIPLEFEQSAGEQQSRHLKERCCRSTSRSPSAGKTPSPTRPPARSPAITSPGAACPTRR